MRLLSLLAVLVVLSPSTALAAKSSSSTAKSVSSLSSSQSCLIKGNISTDKKKENIYHVAGCTSYKATIIDTSKGERWFCTEKEAKDAGWRKALNCPK